MLLPKTKFDLVLGCGYDDSWIEFSIEKGRASDQQNLESAEKQFNLWLEYQRDKRGAKITR